MGRIVTYRFRVKLIREGSEVKVIKLDEPGQEFDVQADAWEQGSDILMLAKNVGDYNQQEVEKAKRAMFDCEDELETTLYEKRICQ